MNLITCTKCSGRKILTNYLHVEGGVCFLCMGSGMIEPRNTYTQGANVMTSVPHAPAHEVRFETVIFPRAEAAKLTLRQAIDKLEARGNEQDLSDINTIFYHTWACPKCFALNARFIDHSNCTVCGRHFYADDEYALPPQEFDDVDYD